MLDDSLTKAGENLVALLWAPQPLVLMLEMFAIAPLFEPPSSSTTVAPTTEGPLQTEADRERGLLLLLQQHQKLHSVFTIGMVYMSMTSIRSWSRDRHALSPNWLTCYSRFSLGFFRLFQRLRLICRCVVRLLFRRGLYQYILELMHLRGEWGRASMQPSLLTWHLFRQRFSRFDMR